MTAEISARIVKSVHDVKGVQPAVPMESRLSVSIAAADTRGAKRTQDSSEPVSLHAFRKPADAWAPFYPELGSLVNSGELEHAIRDHRRVLDEADAAAAPRVDEIPRIVLANNEGRPSQILAMPVRLASFGFEVTTSKSFVMNMTRAAACHIPIAPSP
jgi:hypothetical protein